MADSDSALRKLQVANARPEDSGRGLAHLPRALMAALGLAEGDVIEVVGKRSTPARAVAPYAEDEGLEIIRIDGLQRANAGVGSGEFVGVRKAESKPATRVVFVTSAAHFFSYREGVRLAPSTDTHEAPREKHDPIKAYAESKLCVIFLAKLFAVACEASRRPTQKKVLFFAAHPGAVLTKGGERARKECGGVRGAVLNFVGRPFVKSAEAVAANSTHCCVFQHEEARKKNGAYFVNCEARAASKKAVPETRNDEFAEQLARGAYDGE